MATDGLKADSYREWITKSIEIDDFTNILFSNFVVGTPAFGTSKKERNLYDHYGFINEMDYDKLYHDLFDGVAEFHSVPKYSDLKDKILHHAWLNFVTMPETVSECCYFYSCDKGNDKLYKAKFINKSTKGMKQEEKSNLSKAKEKLVVINQFFSHIRNGFAHGCFSIKMQKEECYYIIQDESPNGFISARIVLLKTTFEKIINYLDEREKQLIEMKGEKSGANTNS